MYKNVTKYLKQFQNNQNEKTLPKGNHQAWRNGGA